MFRSVSKYIEILFTSFRSINPLSGLVIPAQVILELNSHCDTLNTAQAAQNSKWVQWTSEMLQLHTYTYRVFQKNCKMFFLQYLQKEKG